MADGPDVSELVRRTMEANARFYQGWVNLSLEYFRGLTDIFGGLDRSAPAPASAASGPGESAGAVVLEGEEGSEASGSFLVTNDLGRNLTCDFVATGPRDPDGRSGVAKVRFDPPRVDLAPGEQRVVQATIAVAGDLAPGVAYNGTFGIKGMAGFSVPFVLRRRHGVDASPIDRMDTAEAAQAAKEGAAKKAPARKAPAKKAPAKKASATKASAKKASATKASAKKASAKETAAKTASSRSAARTRSSGDRPES